MSKIIAIVKEKMMQAMPTCEKVARLKSESMDSQLTLRQNLAVKSHFIFCQWCRKYGKQLDMIRQAARKFNSKDDNSENNQTPKLSSEAKERLKKLLNN